MYIYIYIWEIILGNWYASILFYVLQMAVKININIYTRHSRNFNFYNILIPSGDANDEIQDQIVTSCKLRALFSVWQSLNGITEKCIT